ncbi:unnamed protein product [Cylindrotheca closterium]|uniref:Helicase-associated domain-containing protein n=1 Tax=Cylindrotheca closterium TaxID=2856 RepID=A0AAD2CIK1_9STRA|nr:unnamed protein product [Cylindrotheca closterium]
MASALPFLLQLGLTAAFQPGSVHTILSDDRQQTSHYSSPTRMMIPQRGSHNHRLSIYQRSATASDETEDSLIDEEKQVSSQYDWDEQFEILQSFKEEYGHCNFPQNNAPAVELENQYPTLAKFCQDQRGESKKKLSSPQRRRLEELGFEFNSQCARWYDTYHQLIQYRNDNGHLRVRNKENSKLYRWCKTQCGRRKGTKGYSKISNAQIELLDNIGFEWDPKLEHDELWMKTYKELVDFRNKHGHLLVESDGKLALWMNMQRWRCAGNSYRCSPLSDEQIGLLNEIEFPWQPERHDMKWHAKYKELEGFQKEYGHCRPSTLQDRPLYEWSKAQRKKRHKGSLSTQQIQMLDKINFSWESKRGNRANMLAELNSYYNQHGHLQVREDEYPGLYEWTRLQRKRYHGIIEKQPMPDKQIDEMEAVNFCWSLDWKEWVWREKYSEAAEFYKEHGHVRVQEKENPSLYNWIATQGKRYEGTKGQKPLSDEELELLEQIDFAFFEKQPPMSWNMMYAKLERYREENDGQFPTHQDDPELNRWMRQQRKRLRCEYGYVALLDEQMTMLESIDFPMLPIGKHRRVWYEKYDELVEFREQHGHFLVDQSRNPGLSKWIAKLRTIYTGRTPPTYRPLFISEQYLLDRIGFPWISDRYEVEWQMMYKELVQFQQEHGHMQVTIVEYPALYAWISFQRERYKKLDLSSMPQHQIEQLNKIGFRWRAIDEVNVE